MQEAMIKPSNPRNKPRNTNQLHFRLFLPVMIGQATVLMTVAITPNISFVSI